MVDVGYFPKNINTAVLSDLRPESNRNPQHPDVFVVTVEAVSGTGVHKTTNSDVSMFSTGILSSFQSKDYFQRQFAITTIEKEQL